MKRGRLQRRAGALLAARLLLELLLVPLEVLPALLLAQHGRQFVGIVALAAVPLHVALTVTWAEAREEENTKRSVVD